MSESKQSKAVALRYRADDDSAPVVIASGYGDIAEKIVSIAEQKGIPVFRDDSVASLMCMLDVGRSIPPDLYEVVAAIYCKILDISKEIKNKELTASVEHANELKNSTEY
ncbi:MAG: EscU/YscU/HrcU family type III secretion system export apparatus switch protein [Angelakisella sp.]